MPTPNLYLYDRVKETSTTTGTGSLTLAGAVTGFRTFASVLSSTHTTYYVIEDSAGNWETGIGTFTSPATLARTTVKASSNSNAAVNFPAGTKYVYIDASADALKMLPGAYNLTGQTSFTNSDTFPFYSFLNGENRKVDMPNLAGYIRKPAEGRLTLTSGSPVTTADVTSTTLYYAPYLGDRIAYYHSSGYWYNWGFGELSITTSGLSANTVYDVFYYGIGSTLELVAWSTSGAGTSTRATALVFQDGVYCKSGDLGRRYLGTVRTNASTQFSDTEAARFVWNVSNQAPRKLYVLGSTAHAYATSTVRHWNNVQTGVAWVQGLNGPTWHMLHATVRNGILFMALNGAAGWGQGTNYYWLNYNAAYTGGTNAATVNDIPGYHTIDMKEYGIDATTYYSHFSYHGTIWA